MEYEYVMGLAIIVGSLIIWIAGIWFSGRKQTVLEGFVDSVPALVQVLADEGLDERQIKQEVEHMFCMAAVASGETNGLKINTRLVRVYGEGTKEREELHRDALDQIEQTLDRGRDE